MLLLVIVSAAPAAGLGPLTVGSAIGEPLLAEIDLRSAEDEQQILIPRLVSADRYPAGGFVFNPALQGSRLHIRNRPDGRRIIEVVSPRPVHEPFVHLLVELESNTTRIVRAYTVLLDPPGERSSLPAAAFAPAVIAAPPAAAGRGSAARQVRRPAPDADAQTLAAMLKRVAALEVAVAQLQRQWDGAAVAATATSAEQALPPRRPPPPMPPVAAPQVTAAPQTAVGPAGPSDRNDLLNEALLVLVIGLLVLLGGLVYLVWGRPALHKPTPAADGA